MATTVGNVTGGPRTTKRHNLSESYRIVNSFSMSVQHVGSSSPIHRLDFTKQTNSAHILSRKFSFSCVSSWLKWRNPQRHATLREQAALCMSSGTHGNETIEYIGSAEDCPDLPRFQTGGGKPGKVFNSTLVNDDPNIPKTHRIYSGQGLAEACRFVQNDAKFVNERARNDIVLLSRGLTRLNNRAREDVAILGLKFLKLDARAREDTEKIDHGVKKRAECLHHIAMILKDKAGSKLKRVADQHWSDGALEADLRRADLLVKTRAMKDAYMALEFVKNIHDMMVSRMNELTPNDPGSLSFSPSSPRRQGFSSANDVGHIMLEKNGKALDFLTGEISADRITAIQEIYWSMASALSEADGIDYTDPEELEWLVTTLIDLDAMDGKISASLLAECSNSPDVSTRKALANALAAAPSMWTLGNAGMGALQRLAEDSNPAVAAAASKAITELKRQWEVEEGDSLWFTMNPLKADEDTQDD